MSKKENNKNKKSKKIIKRTYNEMIEEPKKIIDTDINNKKEYENEIFKNKVNDMFKLNNIFFNQSNKLFQDNQIKNLFNGNYNLEKEYMPPIILIEKNSSNRNLNNIFYKILKENNAMVNDEIQLKYLKIKESSIVIENIYRDGNCFFRAISFFFSGSEEYHIFFRKLIYNYINYHLEEILFRFPYVYFRGKTTETVEYIPYITKIGNIEVN